MTKGGIPLGQWSGSDATNALHETIKRFNAAADAQTKEMVKLTRTVTYLTWAMFFAVAVQIGMTAAALLHP
jgi:hypothetical protein